MAEYDATVVTNIEGLEELEEAFTTGNKRAVKKFLRRVEFQAAKVLVDSAKEFAPYETGQLEGDIHRQTVQSDGALTVRVGPSQNAYWGLIQEIGAPARNVPALHWLENSAIAVQDQVLEEFYEGLTEGLKDMKK